MRRRPLRRTTAHISDDKRNEALRVLDDEELELVKLETEFYDGGTVIDETGVPIAVRRPADAPYPKPATALGHALEDQIDHDVTVILEFVEGASADG